MQIANKIPGLPEPDPFEDAEFRAWRGFLRVHSTIARELDRALREQHDLALADYGLLITLVSAPEMRLRMGELGTRLLITPSKVSRTVERLERDGLVSRSADPADLRSFFATLTGTGLRRLRSAQLTHHAIVRKRLLGPLSRRQIHQLNQIWEKAIPGAVNAEVWPPPEHRVDAQPARTRRSRSRPRQ